MEANSNITIRKAVPPTVAAEIPCCMEKALEFIRSKYPDVTLDVDYIFSSSYTRSRYYRNSHEVGAKPCVCISTRATIMLYDMKSLGLWRTKLKYDNATQMVTALIHELTHHVQYEKGWPHGELLTTQNELEWLKDNEPAVWEYFMVNC